MSRATQRTKLPLDRWAAILGINPLHFNQVISVNMPSSLCTNVWHQFAWQDSGQVGREDIAFAIAQAENDLEEYLRYPLLPIWINDERSPVTPPGDPSVINISLTDRSGFPLNVHTRWKHFVSGGIEAKDLIEAGATVTYTDTDGDGYAETATVTVVTTVTDPAEIAVYVPGEAANDSWEIRPLNDPKTRRRSVTISGGSAVIVMAREQLVDPDLQDAFDPAAVDGQVAGNFLATVDVYRHYNDPQTQVTLMWRPRPGPCDCANGSCVICQYTVQTGCLLSQNQRNGIVSFRPAEWNATTVQFDSRTPSVGRAPENLRLFYRAGYQSDSPNVIAPTLEMDLGLERAVTYMSLKYLSRPVCGCDNVRELFKRMTEDVALNLGQETGSSSYQLSDTIINCPFGTERGAVLAWQTVKQGNRTVGHAVKI